MVPEAPLKKLEGMFIIIFRVVFVYMKLFCSGARRPMAYVPCGHS